MGITNEVMGPAHMMKAHSLPPEVLTALYQELWAEIDKAIFILKGTM